MFVLSKIAWELLSPGNLLALILALGVALSASAVRMRARLGRLLCRIAAVCFAAIALVPLGDRALLSLEDRFAASPPPPAHVDGIVVLGGSVEQIISAERGQPVLSDASERLTTMLALARRYPDAMVVHSGGSGLLRAPGLPESDVVRAFLAQQGLPPDRVIYEERSRNTYENAVETQRLVRPRPGQVWLLVTSAAHMPRAMGIFRRLGWPVLPVPVDYRAEGGWPATIDLAGRLTRLTSATREWLGLVAYRLLDRTDTLFPAPNP